MALVFQSSAAAIRAYLVQDGQIADKAVTVPGVTSGAITPATARTQLNKVLNVAGLEITTSGMKRTIVEEVVNE